MASKIWEAIPLEFKRLPHSGFKKQYKLFLLGNQSWVIDYITKEIGIYLISYINHYIVEKVYIYFYIHVVFFFLHNM